jgi:putative FmdB family regulatory protein
MPLYSYCCEQCGTFEDWRKMSQSADSALCPQCGGSARRAIEAPFLSTLSSHSRIAHERNEKSAHEPMVMGREQLQRSGLKRSEVLAQQGHSCHGHHHNSRHHVHRSRRPWMIGH